MKLVKLSLVAAMAAGVFATTASAAPLDEMIKDIDVSGYARLRYTNDSVKKNRDSGDDGKSTWNFKGELNLKSKIDDNFFAVVGIRYDNSDDGQHLSTSSYKDDDNFKLHRAYFGYNYGGTTIQVGRQDVGAFFTADMYGDGIKILNSDIEGLTLAALWMDSLEEDGDIGSIGADGGVLVADRLAANPSWVAPNLAEPSLLEIDAVAALTGKRVTDHNLYGVAAIGSYDPVSFQIWYAVLEDVTDLFAVELATNFDVTADFNLGLKGQYGFSDFDGDLKKGNLISDGQIWAVEASTNVQGLDISAGYVDFSADDDKTVSLVAFEDNGQYIKPGEELFDYTLFRGENSYWFVTAGFTFPDTGFRIGADYLDGETTWYGKDYDAQEIVARLEYAHSKKLKFKAWYSWMEEDAVADGYEKDRVRFEAKYSF
ncbi:major outer membrane protein [Campylobacter corcagiensis]|uniref:Major outer membrane protein n=1 Tax=Campylobacter corcagiensis TaxID=1448857 RepID=A0A7M1LJ75_9BACT|nr:major outer membrane protein [Campylobacter corcagiensis]QKF64243.1 major outer membrane protein [Campylobacter corcagiensis]QOQ87565.1 major outer membrane protein [Campylobacter corcagiensis]